MELGAGELQVWSVKLTGSDETVAALEKLLSPAEAERCRRFHQVIHQRAYALSHGVLRLLVGRYLGSAPQQIAFRHGHAGKPALDNADPCLEFNMSHSGDLAVYAFANDSRLGIDVEQVRAMTDLEAVAARFFSPEECAELLALREEERTEAFFRCWTRKEAYIKAVGDGLSLPLDSFRVTLAPGAPAALVHTELGSSKNWQMHHFVPEARSVGAVVYAGAPRCVQEWPLLDAGQARDRLAAD